MRKDIMSALISVLFLTHNDEKNIEDSIKGLLSQIFCGIELIILDDASNDRTIDIIERNIPKLEKKFLKVEFYKNTVNVGSPAANLNSMIELSHGEYIMHVSGDDMLLPDAFSTLYAFLENNKEYGVVYSAMYIADGDWQYKDGFYDLPRIAYYPESRELPEEIFEIEMSHCNIIAEPTSLIRRTVFEKYGLRDENAYIEDYEYWLRICRDVKIFYINAALVIYRRSENSITNFSAHTDNVLLNKSIKGDIYVVNKYIGELETEEKKYGSIFGLYRSYKGICDIKDNKEGIIYIVDWAKTVNAKAAEDLLADWNEREIYKYDEVIKAWDGRIAKNIRFLEEEFTRRGIKTIAIYGYGIMGKRFEKAIGESIKISFIIDKKEADNVIHPYDSFPSEIDAVVITMANSNNSDIKLLLRDRCEEDRIINLTDLILERY